MMSTPVSFVKLFLSLVFFPSSFACLLSRSVYRS
jgi:hypothetical protein